MTTWLRNVLRYPEVADINGRPINTRFVPPMEDIATPDLLGKANENNFCPEYQPGLLPDALSPAGDVRPHGTMAAREVRSKPK